MGTLHTFPVAYAGEIAIVAARWNVPPVALLSEIGLTLEDLEDPTRLLSLEDFAILMETACRVTAEPAFGVYVGLHGRISAHGYLGFAAMTARTLREAIDLAVRFAPTCTTAFAFALEVAGKTASLLVDEVAVFERAREPIVHAAVVGLWRMGSSIVGRELVGGADFAFPEPAFVRRLESVVAAPGTVRYGQPRHRLIFDADQLVGGYFANHVGCMRHDLVRGIAPHSGGGPPAGCSAGPIPALIIHGTADTLIWYSCGVQARDTWVAHNGCSTAVDVIAVKGGVCEYNRGCPAGGQVGLCRLEGMGHGWAGIDGADGGGSQYENVSRVIWDFFARQ